VALSRTGCHVVIGALLPETGTRCPKGMRNMTIRISAPAAIGILVVALGILGYSAWRFFAKERIPVDAKGNPTRVAPVEAQGGFNAMQDLWKSGVRPDRPAPAVRPRTSAPSAGGP